MTAIWGPSRPCRAKEVVFVLLLPGHRIYRTKSPPPTLEVGGGRGGVGGGRGGGWGGLGWVG